MVTVNVGKFTHIHMCAREHTCTHSSTHVTNAGGAHIFMTTCYYLSIMHEVFCRFTYSIIVTEEQTYVPSTAHHHALAF